MQKSVNGRNDGGGKQTALADKKSVFSDNFKERLKI